VELQVVRQRSRRADTTPDGKPFSWQGRLRVVGGRTNVWARQSCASASRISTASRSTNCGEDWPLSYTIWQCYDIVEDYVRISGQAENVPEPARRSFPSGDADELCGDAAPHA
jgi:hypothetical protein